MTEQDQIDEFYRQKAEDDCAASLPAPIPPAMVEAAGKAARAYAGFEGNGGEIDDYDYYRELARTALEAVGIAKLQAAADALPGLVAALEAVCALRLEETLTYAKGSPIDRALKGVRKALAAAKGGAQ